MNNIFKQQGIGIVGAIVGIAVLLIILLALTQLFSFNLKAQELNESKIESANLAAEAIEAVYSVKNEDWDSHIASLTLGSNYYPQVAANKWILTAGTEAISQYTRRVVFEQVLRDVDDNIAGAGVADANSRKVTAYVEWNNRGVVEQVSLEVYITNWKN